MDEYDISIMAVPVIELLEGKCAGKQGRSQENALLSTMFCALLAFLDVDDSGLHGILQCWHSGTGLSQWAQHSLANIAK